MLAIIYQQTGTLEVEGCYLYAMCQQSKLSQEERASKGTPSKDMSFIQEENDGNRSKGASKLVSVCQEIQAHNPHCKRSQQNKCMAQILQVVSCFFPF